VPKKSGGERKILAPIGQLKIIQKRLAKDLGLIEQQLETHRAKRQCILAHGFKNGLSIITNSENHRRRRYVFNVDLKDFFPSINFGRVYGFFLKNADFQLKPKVAAVLAQIACHDNQLPQGSPCSPVISNLIAHVLDIRLNELARRHHCTYTRYADDITFSTSEKLFSPDIAVPVLGTLNQWEAGKKLLTCIKRAGFELNPAKTRMQLRYSRQNVTGLVINQKVNIPVDYYATVSAMCDRLFKDGECHINIDGIKKPFSREKLRGRLAFIYQIRGMGPKGDKTGLDATTEKKIKPTKIWASFKLFERFLDYVSLYGAKRTVVLCEGVTDNIYIKSALQTLAPKYPSLINAGPDGALKVTLFKYTKTSAAVQHLAGGSGQLKNLANTYASRTKGFKSGAEYPLILVADFDEGSKDLFRIVRDRTAKTVDGSEPWYHLDANLYVVPIPKVGGADTPIERLFEQSVLDTKLDGKTFDIKSHEKDGSKFYSKKTFATKVIAAKREPSILVGSNLCSTQL
jgi:RNA-directed DNA polymerase